MRCDVLVLGAGMVGTCTALQLARRGRAVVLVDRGAPGSETSHGNAGLIQREAVEPYPFPREFKALLKAALRRGVDVHYHPGALPALLPRLWRYWAASAPSRYATIAVQYSRLIEHCLAEHEVLMAECGAEALVRRTGYRHVYRSGTAFAAAAKRAEGLALRYGLRFAVQGPGALAQAEPGLLPGLAGAVHWLETWCVGDPGELVRRYAARFEALGGQSRRGDAATLRRQGEAWQMQTSAGPVAAAHAVVALGPWSAPLLRCLGYRLPMFVKRGYHRHFAGDSGLRVPLYDAERGYVLAPMARGLRLTTGAEFARLGAPATPVQLAKATQAAQELVRLGEALDEPAWLGNRPCTVDMKPVVGPAPRDPGLWFNFGHAHQGFTLGPASARLLADLMDGAVPYIDPAPYAPARFG
jgi:D-amino-acid dehydrogenase